VPYFCVSVQGFTPLMQLDRNIWRNWSTDLNAQARQTIRA